MLETKYRLCIQCGKLFESVKKDHRLCSKKCREKYRLKKQPPMVTKTCEYCGKQYKSKYEHQRFCSNICKSYFYRELKNSNGVLKKCLECGTLFSTTNSVKRYCSPECRYKAKLRREHLRYLSNKGKNNEYIKKER